MYSTIAQCRVLGNICPKLTAVVIIRRKGNVSVMVDTPVRKISSLPEMIFFTIKCDYFGFFFIIIIKQLSYKTQ